jgi:Zn-finger nucleic acid-binding protein
MILACPTCDSRYDVTGYSVGQQFRCRCGTVTELKATSASAGLLACPHCGANVATTSSTCEHCSTALLLKACPRCMSRVFHGHKHCPECGAGLEEAAAGEVTDMACPRCDKPLLARRVGDVVIDECGDCHGLFLDQVAVKRIVSDRAQARAEALLGALPKHAIAALPPAGGRMYVKCPQCRAVMNRRQFAQGAGVIIDVCKAHGTFFDAGELPVVIEFVMGGGLERAQKAEIARMRDAAKAERQNAQFAQMMASHSSTHAFETSSRMDRGLALVDLLTTLFR